MIGHTALKSSSSFRNWVNTQYTAYNYFDWFISTNQQCIIITPNRDGETGQKIVCLDVLVIMRLNKEYSGQGESGDHCFLVRKHIARATHICTNPHTTQTLIHKPNLYDSNADILRLSSVHYCDKWTKTG